MKAWLLDDFIGLDALRLAEVPDPVPAAGEVVLELEYAALNPADRYLAERLYPLKPALPHILGRDGVGKVVQLGAEVAEVKIGERRLISRGDTGGTRPGTFAQRAAVPAEDLVAAPAGWTVEESGGASLVYLTAYQALTMWGPLPEPAVVLVTGASGGVGVAGVQLAHAMGSTVVALSRSAAKGERLKQIGANYVLNPEDPEWRKSLKKLLSPRRVDLAIDNIGGTLFSEVIDTLGDQGCVSAVGRLAGPVPNFNTATLFFRRIRIGGVAVGAYTKPEAREAWRHVVELMGKIEALPIVDSVFPLSDLRKAFDRLAQGPLGKVLLKVTE